MELDIKPITISGGWIICLIFVTWIVISAISVEQAKINTEYRMRTERLEDIAFGINVPITQKVKTTLKNGE